MRNNNPEWQQEYFGRHVQMVPAEFASGYQYRGPVIRAIPAEGQVTDPGQNWAMTPQSAYWMGEKQKKYQPDVIRFIKRIFGRDRR